MNCIKCDKKLNLFNKPTFGLGKLKDDNELCHSCFRTITKIDLNLTRKLKNYTLSEVNAFLTSKKETQNNNSTIDFKVTVDSTSTGSSEEKAEYDAYTKKYPKWFAGENTKGLCYKSERITPLEKGIEEIVHYKTDRYADLFGRGKDCSYFPGYGKIYNRIFEIWFQEFGSKEKQNIIRYMDIGANQNAPFFNEELTEGWLINNELERTQGFKKLFNVRVTKTRRTWYAGLIDQEFTGIIADREKE